MVCHQEFLEEPWSNGCHCFNYCPKVSNHALAQPVNLEETIEEEEEEEYEL